DGPASVERPETLPAGDARGPHDRLGRQALLPDHLHALDRERGRPQQPPRLPYRPRREGSHHQGRPTPQSDATREPEDAPAPAPAVEPLSGHGGERLREVAETESRPAGSENRAPTSHRPSART